MTIRFQKLFISESNFVIENRSKKMGRKVKRNPSTRWFFNDWHNDEALQLCSLEARGAWIEMLGACSENGGYLLLAGRPPTIADLARYVRATTTRTQKVLDELERNQVFSRTAEGVIYNRRLARAGVGCALGARCAAPGCACGRNARNEARAGSFQGLSKKDTKEPITCDKPESEGARVKKSNKIKANPKQRPPGASSAAVAAPHSNGGLTNGELKAKRRDLLISKHLRYLAAMGTPNEIEGYSLVVAGDDPAAAQLMLDTVDRQMRKAGWDG